MFDVVVVGSLNLDLVASTQRLPGPGETVTGFDFHEYPGGKGLNQAVAASRAGARVAIVGAVGHDAAGEILRGVVVDEGIDDRWLITAPTAPTGRALIGVDTHAENSIIVVPGANHAIRIDDSLPDARVVLAQLEIPIDAVAAAFTAAKSSDAVTILNPAPSSPLPHGLLSDCDVLVPNEHEVADLGGIDVIRTRVPHLLVTLGAIGVDSIGASGRLRHEPFHVSPVDTTGAGDAFCGALAARLAEPNTSIDSAVPFAAAAGALATTEHGAVPSLPRRAAVEALLAEQPR